MFVRCVCRLGPSLCSPMVNGGLPRRCANICTVLCLERWTAKSRRLSHDDDGERQSYARGEPREGAKRHYLREAPSSLVRRTVGAMTPKVFFVSKIQKVFARSNNQSIFAGMRSLRCGAVENSDHILRLRTMLEDLGLMPLI